jgi:hypothetical protein
LVGEIETGDIGLHEADSLGKHVLERDAHRIGGPCSARDSGQLSEHLVVVVPVDQKQLGHWVVAQLGCQAQGDM